MPKPKCVDWTPHIASVAQSRVALTLLEDGWSPYKLEARPAPKGTNIIGILYQAGRYLRILPNGVMLYTVDGGA